MGIHWSRHQFVIPQEELDGRCPPAVQRRLISLSRFVRRYDVPVHPEIYQLLIALAEDTRFRLFEAVLVPSERGWGYLERGLVCSKKAYPDRYAPLDRTYRDMLKDLLSW